MNSLDSFTRIMAEEGGDGVEAHAPVDGLGGERVAELVSGDVLDPGGRRLVMEDLADPVAGERPVRFDQEAVRAQPGGPVVGDPVVEKLFELGVQRDGAVVVELADRDAQPEGRADLHDGVDTEGPRRMPVRARSSVTSRARGSIPARRRAPAMISSRPAALRGWPRRWPFSTTNSRSVGDGCGRSMSR